MTLTYPVLLDAVAGDGVGFRARIPLEPLGGPGDKVAPPTYSVARDAQTAYAVETRRVDGEPVAAVVLDSVASQANRLESALLAAYRSGELSVPLVTVDFREAEGVEGLDRISALEAPHRIFDAILRDSLLGDTLFRLSAVGQAITEAAPRDVSALFRHAPHTLVFGGWDSTGPRGGRGSKYERALTSEIVATGIATGSKTASRIDPLAIERKAGPIYEALHGSWTTDPNLAVKDAKGKPVPVKSSGEEEPGRPSQINHGNVAPSIDTRSGGITAENIYGTTVLSLIQLRRLRFPRTTDGTVVPGDRRRDVETAGHAALAALGIAAIVLGFDDGFDLRSRCVLHATADLELELVRRGAAETQTFPIDRGGALTLLDEAQAKAAAAGLEWEQEEIILRPIDGLVELVRRSQEIAATSAD
jgi:CRISPR-associated protein Csb1